MQQKQSKQVIISEAEATIISDVLKEKIVSMVRSSTYDYFDLDVMGKLQKRYEDIVKYIRSKDIEA